MYNTAIVNIAATERGRFDYTRIGPYNLTALELTSRYSRTEVAYDFIRLASRLKLNARRRCSRPDHGLNATGQNVTEIYKKLSYRRETARHLRMYI